MGFPNPPSCPSKPCPRLSSGVTQKHIHQLALLFDIGPGVSLASDTDSVSDAAAPEGDDGGSGTAAVPKEVGSLSASPFFRRVERRGLQVGGPDMKPDILEACHCFEGPLLLSLKSACLLAVYAFVCSTSGPWDANIRSNPFLTHFERERATSAQNLSWSLS